MRRARGPCVALAVALAPALVGAVEFEPDEEHGPASLALGPVRPGGAHVALDAGYVRSGARADLGLAANIDLGIRAEVFTTRHGLSGQKGLFLGVRWSPVTGDTFRASLTGEGGFALVPLVAGSRELLVVRGELAAGYLVSGVLPYARAALRGVRWDASAVTGWDTDAELAAGVERGFGRRLILAAEGGTWLQPGVKGLFQWRIRAGLAF